VAGIRLGRIWSHLFQQLLALWAASTAIFLVSLTAGRLARVSWPRRLALLLPSLWLLLAIVLPEVGVRTWSRALFYVAIVLTLAGMPFLAALLLRVTIAGYEQIPNRRRLLAAAIVGIVAITSFGLGRFNNLETVSPASSHQPVLMGVRSRGRARRHIQLGEDIAQMALHGLWA